MITWSKIKADTNLEHCDRTKSLRLLQNMYNHEKDVPSSLIDTCVAISPLKFNGESKTHYYNTPRNTVY
jgi:hypothetical protein